MSAPTFTPGPWVIHEREHPERDETGDNGFLTAAYVGTVQESPGASYRFVCEISGWGADYSADKVQQANARLIAAAPALLANLEQMDRLIRQFIAGDLLQFPASALFTSAEALKEARGEDRS